MKLTSYFLLATAVFLSPTTASPTPITASPPETASPPVWRGAFVVRTNAAGFDAGDIISVRHRKPGAVAHNAIYSHDEDDEYCYHTLIPRPDITSSDLLNSIYYKPVDVGGLSPDAPWVRLKVDKCTPGDCDFHLKTGGAVDMNELDKQIKIRTEANKASIAHME